MSRKEKKDSVKKATLKQKLESKMKETINTQIDQYLERGDTLTKGDFVRLAKGMIKTEIDKKVPAPLKKTADPTGLKSALSRSTDIGSSGASKKKVKRAVRKAKRKARRIAKRHEKRRDKALGLAAFLLALTVGIVYKATSKL